MIDLCLFCHGDRNDPRHEVTCSMPFYGVTLASYVPEENVRTTDPETSAAAARSLDVSEVQQRVLKLHHDYRQAGLTDEELLQCYRSIHGPTAESSPRKRRHDLTRAGFLVDSGLRRPLVSGRMGIVWVLVEK